MAQEINKDSNKPKHFKVPEGYFMTSAKVIQNKVEWEEEHWEYPLLKRLKNKLGLLSL